MKQALSQWTTLSASGDVTEVLLKPRRKPGRKPTLMSIHKRLSDGVRHPMPRNSLRLMVNGNETPVLAAKVEGATFAERIEQHRALLDKRKVPLAAENHWPTGQAMWWYVDAVRCMPMSAMLVVRQIARLCGEDSQVSVPIRSVADAVGRTDNARRLVAFTERGIQALIDAGWLAAETSGQGQNIITTYYLMAGDPKVDWLPDDDGLWDELMLDEL